MANQQNRKYIYNMHPLLDQFVQHYATYNATSWTAALFELLAIGYDDWIESECLAYLDVDMDDGGLFDEYLALPKPRPSTKEFLIQKTRPKPGRPRKIKSD